MTTVRTNITIDDDLKTKATAVAKEMGISFSALVRLLLIKTTNKKSSGVEKGLLDYINGDYTRTSVDDFLNELDSDIESGKGV
jgi:antitoxin component of RelBE/YafQ-DinJ toxin-antitoxin module